MSYLTRLDAITALKKMKKFHDSLGNLMEEHGFNIYDNLGRRNILLSEAQEKYFAESLAKKFDAENNGKTGEPDISIYSLDRELECKLTSPQKNGRIAFQTDYATLTKKEILDYLYVVASEDFNQFAVIHYTDLTADDFSMPVASARGKAKMLKYRSHDRSNILLGDMININERELKKLYKKLPLASTAKKKMKIEKSIEYWETKPASYEIIMESIDEAA